MTASNARGTAPYEFKAGPYSSHTLLLRQFAPRGNGLRVLDVGCAGGYLAEVLAGWGYAVTGVDRPGVDVSDGIAFVPADLDAGLPPLDGRFDFILCADVLEHLHSPLRILEECRRRLAPGGLLIASLPNSGHAYFRWNILRGRFPRHERGLFDRTHLHFYTRDGWTELFAAAGFRIEGAACSGVPVGLALPGWNRAAVRVLEGLSFQSAQIWPCLFAYQFVVRARPEGGN